MDSNNMLNYLFMVSNKNILLNVYMHLIVIAAIISLYILKSSKAKKNIFNGTVLVLTSSVTINAVVHGNPFHEVTFGIITIIAVVVLIQGKNPITMPQKGVRTIIAFEFIIIGLWYPEFVNVNIFKCLLVSPIGVAPCPTLITILGMLNLYYPKVNKLQFNVTVCFGLVYGIVGTIGFGVRLDLSLIGIVIYSIYNIMTNSKAIG
jgi:hypothetical protein